MRQFRIVFKAEDEWIYCDWSDLSKFKVSGALDMYNYLTKYNIDYYIEYREEMR